MSSSITIGVDIGQRVDPTAIAVVERERREAPADRREWHHIVRYLGRLPLGTPYPEVADRLVQVATGVRDRTGEQPTLYIDATGVGQPIVDVLTLHRVPAWMIAVYFTYGDRRIVEQHDRVTLGKAWLVSRMQALFQGNRLHLPPGHPEAQTMTDELLDYEIRVDKNANDTYGAFRVGTHDDLVTALGLATQVDEDLYAEAFGKSGYLSAPDAVRSRRKPVQDWKQVDERPKLEIGSLDDVLGKGWRQRRRWG
jgi:hypothetical protein